MKQQATPPRLSPIQDILILIVFSLIIYIKGVALWRAAQGKQINWFIGLFVLFIFGFVSPIFFILSPVLDLVFLFKYAKNKVYLSDLTKKRSLTLPKFTRGKK